MSKTLFNKIKQGTVILLLWLFTAPMVSASLQPDSVVLSYSGVIQGEKNEALAYAVISVEKSNISTVSNAEGEFQLKIPAELVARNITVTFLGYKNLSIPISNLQEKGNRLTLASDPFILPVLEVVTKDPVFIVQNMFQNRAKNYCRQDMLMTAFYRETIRKRNTNVSLSEAVVEVYKRGVTSNLNDMASLFKSRKSTDYSRLDTIVFRLMGGPYNNIYLDVARYPEIILPDNFDELYDFKINSTDIIDGHTVYVLEFKQFDYIAAPLYYGKLYIDVENYALVKAEFDLDLRYNDEATRQFIKKKPLNARVSTTQASYVVNYRMIDGLWYYAYSRIDLGLRINWRRKLFNTHYNTSIEMAATDWERNITRQIFKEKRRISPTVIIQNETRGFTDTDFWGEYNIIEPDKSIENAINKIIKQLGKEKQ